MFFDAAADLKILHFNIIEDVIDLSQATPPTLTLDGSNHLDISGADPSDFEVHRAHLTLKSIWPGLPSDPSGDLAKPLLKIKANLKHIAHSLK